MFNFGKNKKQSDDQPDTVKTSIPAVSINSNEVDIEGLTRAVTDISKGRYDNPPKDTDDLSRAVAQLSTQTQDKSTRDMQDTVDLSISLTDETIAAAKMMRDVQHINSQSNTIAAASEEMTASVSEISRASLAAADEMGETYTAAQKGIGAARKAVETMSEIATAVHDSASRVNILSESSQQIGDIVSDIEAIASQTNLLALNATIEAARAGEAGKGFAVVANEVKGLAHQTAQATEDIRSRIDNLRSEMANIVLSMEQGAKVVSEGELVISETGDEMDMISQKVETANGHMHEIAGILKEQQQASNEVSQGVNGIAKLSASNLEQISHVVDLGNESSKKVLSDLQKFMDMDIPDKTIFIAKSDHMLWCKRLAEMVIGRETLNPDELSDHHSCRLGKWYDAISDQSIRQHPAYAALKEPHRDVHAHGIEAAKRYAEGDLNACLDEIEKVSSASAKVLHLLDELAKRPK